MGLQFKSEIKIHKSLQHPNVVAFDRCFEDDENAYILLELCRNQSLSDLLRRRKRLSEAEVRFYVRQLVEGLVYLHKNLVIHRDLKLGNLFLTADMRLKIGDFGLAALLADAFDRKRTLCGTPNYIAPEILTGRATTGHSFEVDIWSTGVVMYTLLVGRPPFETDDVKHTYRRIRASEFAFPEDLDISVNAKAIVHSILRVEPHLRPSLNAILAHPFFQDRPTPMSLPKTALLVTPPECKRVIASNKRSKEASPSDHKARSNPPPPPQKSTLSTRPTSTRKRESATAEKPTTTPTARDRERQPLAVKSTSSGTSSRPPPVPHSVASAKTKSVTPIDATSSRASTATSETPSPPPTSTMTADATVVDADPMATETPPRDPFAVVQETLTRFFYLEEHGNKDDKLSEFSSASVLVAAAKRVKEIRLEHEAASAQTLEPATLWVSQWVDYTSKYGMGYVLSDGSAGVYFNDSTKIVSSGDAMTMEYMDRAAADGNASNESFVRFPSDLYDASLKKKVLLLSHFKSYLIDEREKRADIAAFEAKVSSQSQSGSTTLSDRMVYVKKWLKTKHAVLFCLSNDSFQFNFYDSSRLVMSSDGRVVTYMDKDGKLGVYSTSVAILTREPSDLTKRLRYARDMFEQIIRVNATLQQGQEAAENA
ncbi:hypothetical protein PINS_up016559 [Pythium insidiosum]|nr:hypothetical protein PINS_up016559 [Pythium insidiosum]